MARSGQAWPGSARLGAVGYGRAWQDKEHRGGGTFPDAIAGLSWHGVAKHGLAWRGKAWSGTPGYGRARNKRKASRVPKKRPPHAVWNATRLRILERDGRRCTRCGVEVSESTAHIDHIQSGKLANNAASNLRALCRRCHVLRACHRHQGMIAAALRDGIIGPDWREQVWEG